MASKFKDQLMEDLAKRVQEMVEGEEWHQMLDTMSRFRKYSFRNIMLIMLAKPDATYVAGYKKWGTMNRRPTKGSAIWITGYNSGSKDEVDPETGLKTGKKVGWVSFPPVKVFDFADTYVVDPEKPDPVGDMIENKTGEFDGVGDEEKFSAVQKYLEDIGWSVDVGDAGLADGYTRMDGTKQVVISSEITGLRRLETLIHEAAHVLLHSDESGLPETKGMEEAYEGERHRGIAEVEAESVAYTVLKALGIDNKDNSVGYIAGWSRGDVDLVISVGTRVANARTKILEGVLENKE